MTRPAAAIALLLLTASGALADAPAGGDLAYTPPAVPAPPDVTGLVLRLFAMTAVTLVVCGGAVWGLRRWKQPTAGRGDAGRIRHEGRLQLDRRSAVHLLRVDGQAVAVTTDATGLRSLTVLSEPFEKVMDEAGAGEPGQ